MSFITNLSSPITGVYGPNGYPKDIDNNHGNIRAGGVIAETKSFSSNSLGEKNRITTIVSGVNNIVPGIGVWNQQTQFSDIMKVTTTLGGVANNALLFGASDSAQSDAIHQATTIKVRLYKTAVRAGDWNPLTGWSSEPSVVESGGYNIVAGVDNASTLKSSGTDHAANPSSAIPGELTQHQGVLGEPTNLDYKPRYLW